MPPLTGRIVLSILIIHRRGCKESTLTCHRSSQARLHTRLDRAEELLVLPLELSRNGLKVTKLLLDPHLLVACTMW
jgi:hypothetical protein